ncbi:MAG: hypothetical protein ACK4ON_04880 [Bacteroidia bacterium]
MNIRILVNRKTILSFVFVFIGSITSVFAQDQPSFDDDVLDNPPPVAPIDFWILPMVLIAMFYAYTFFKKREVVN